MKYADQFAATSRSRSVRPALRRRAGFTLIELLVAVTVLMVITLLLARIISQSNIVISEGTRQATQNASARMALDFLAREFAQAGGDPRLHFQRNITSVTPYGNPTPSHDLRFVTFRNVIDLSLPLADRAREGVRVAYYVKLLDPPNDYTYSLMRAEKPITIAEGYTNITYANPSAEEVELIRHVVEFRVVCYTNNTAASAITGDINLDKLPLYMDVYLSVLTETDVRRAAAIMLASGDTARQTYINRNAKRYHTRCWSLNRTAYIRGR